MLDHFFEIGDAQGVEIVFGSKVLAGLALFLLTPKTLAPKKNGRGSGSGHIGQAI